MINYFFYFLFFIFSIFVFLKSVFYALYEIKSQDNKSGGVAVIVLTVIVLFLANIVVFLKGKGI